MAYSKVFFHAGSPCHGCTGIMELFQACEKNGIPFGVYSVENGGMIADMVGYKHAILIYRTLATDVAPYHMTPADAAAVQWDKLMTHLPTEIKANRGRVWVEVGNEQDKNKADWLGWYYVELAGYAARDGYRICGPGWSTGEPEPSHWSTPGWLAFLRLCAANPDSLAVTVHEYSLDADDIMASPPWLVGRVKFLFDTCKAEGIAPPTVFVTEAGWTHNDLPPMEKAKLDIMSLAELYAGYPTVKAAFLWTLIGGGDKKTLAAELNALIPWLTEYTVAARFPDVEPPPPPPPVDPPTEPPPAADNLLLNGSFEEGWTDATTFPGQHPLGWEVIWNTGMDNPHAPWQYMVGEGVHKSDAFLPPAERDVFIWDGEWTYKLFADKKAFWARLKQRLDLPAGRYKLTTPVWVDCYRWAGFKDYAVEPWQAETMVKVNQAEVRPWSLMVSGGKQTIVTEIDHAGGVFDLAVHLRCNWPISNNLWLDGWSLAKVPVTPPPVEPPPPDPEPEPERHRAIVLKLPQDVTAAEWQTAAAYGYQYRHTMTASHDDMLTILRGGNDESYVKLAYPARQADVAALIEAAGYSWQPVLAEDDPAPSAPFEFAFFPVSGGTRRVTQAFGARPEVYAQYGFPGHEGIDLAASLNAPIVAVAAGKVSRVTDTGNYGNRIDITHDGGWVTTYAHLNRFADLRVGDAVVAGQVIGYAGSTGNSTGVHLHLGLKRPGSTYTDNRGTVWPFNIFDPTPYLARYLAQPDNRIDLLPFLQGQHRRQFDMGHDAGTQTVQVWHTGPKDWLYVKGENGEYERLGLRTWNGQEWIFRFEDTSESPDRFYAHYLNEGGPIGAPWLPRLAEVGRWYETSKFVQHYLKAGCVKQNGGPATDKLRVMSYPRVVNYASAQSLARLDEVITVEWSAGEQYDFASGRGCVAFRDANRTFWFIGDLQGRADKTFKKPGCIALGW